MARQWDEIDALRRDDAPGAIENRMLRRCAAMRTMLDHLERDVKLRLQLAGAPHVGEIATDGGEEPIGQIEPVNASAMIPANQLNRADRGGE